MPQTMPSQVGSSQPGLPLLTQQSLANSAQNVAVIVVPVPMTEYQTPGAVLLVPQKPTSSNVAPTVVAGADQSVNEGDWVTVSATASDTDSSFALAIGAGYRFGPVDVKAMLYAPDVDDLVGFSITIGGDFASF